jgi:hypothetical protein
MTTCYERKLVNSATAGMKHPLYWRVSSHTTLDRDAAVSR